MSILLPPNTGPQKNPSIEVLITAMHGINATKDSINRMRHSDLYPKDDHVTLHKDLNTLFTSITNIEKHASKLIDNEVQDMRIHEEKLNLDGKAHFREQRRLLGFRVAATAIFIVSLFTIGTIDHYCKFLHLPLSSYIGNISPVSDEVKPSPVIEVATDNIKG